MKDDPQDQHIQGQASEEAPAQPPGGAADVPPRNPDSLVQGGSIRLFRVAGIDVLLHWSWFLFAVLRLQARGGDDSFGLAPYESPIWYLVEYVTVFGVVLLHEFGHVLACRSVGGTANRIVLWPLGGVAFVDPPARPGAVLWSIAAGPLVNALLLVPTLGFWFACRAAGFQDTAPDLYRFAEGIAWINGYMLLFNLLPVYPLDGGKILQALLWFVLGRARSLLVAAVIGLLTGLGLLVFAIVAGSLFWGILATLAFVVSLLSLQGARVLRRLLDAPRRQEAACPACGAKPPQGNFWVCMRCFRPFDVFASRGHCPNCSTPLAAVLCAECGRTAPYKEWHVEAMSGESLDLAHQPPPAVPGIPQPTVPARPPTVVQRVVWGLIFAVVALFLCGLPSMEKQPLGVIVWTVGGAVLGATSAGTLTRIWQNGRALQKLRGTWRLVAEDGRAIVEGEEEPRKLILNSTGYEERVGGKREVGGACWIDALTEPPAISFTPRTGADAGKLRPGIYRLEGMTLTVGLAYPGHRRPTAFVAQPEVQQVRVYQRGGKAGS